jgi:hypothetical protein
MEENQAGDWELSSTLKDLEPDKAQKKVIHATIKKVGEDIETLSFNTAIAQMMVFVNAFTGVPERPVSALRTLLQLLNPFAPHLTEELWKRMGCAGLVAPNLLLIGVAVASGLGPYVGFKTRSSFSMHSNLRIEPGYSNHIFMPPSMDVLGYLSDSVRVAESADSFLSTLVGSQTERLPYIALCEYLARPSNESKERAAFISYERRGQQLVATQGGDLPGDCPSLIARKLLLFGTVGDGAERRCVW